MVPQQHSQLRLLFLILACTLLSAAAAAQATGRSKACEGKCNLSDPGNDVHGITGTCHSLSHDVPAGADSPAAHASTSLRLLLAEAWTAAMQAFPAGSRCAACWQQVLLAAYACRQFTVRTSQHYLAAWAPAQMQDKAAAALAAAQARLQEMSAQLLDALKPHWGMQPRGNRGAQSAASFPGLFSTISLNLTWRDIRTWAQQGSAGLQRQPLIMSIDQVGQQLHKSTQVLSENFLQHAQSLLQRAGPSADEPKPNMGSLWAQAHQHMQRVALHMTHVSTDVQSAARQWFAPATPQYPGHRYVYHHSQPGMPALATFVGKVWVPSCKALNRLSASASVFLTDWWQQDIAPTASWLSHQFAEQTDSVMRAVTGYVSDIEEAFRQSGSQHKGSSWEAPHHKQHTTAAASSSSQGSTRAGVKATATGPRAASRAAAGAEPAAAVHYPVLDGSAWQVWHQTPFKEVEQHLRGVWCAVFPCPLPASH